MKDMKDKAIRFALEEVIKNAKADIFINSNHIINLRLPKYFRILALCESKTRVNIDATVYKRPTYFSPTNCARNVEFTYAEREICNAKRNDNTYIRFIFVSLICLLYTQ